VVELLLTMVKLERPRGTRIAFEMKGIGMAEIPRASRRKGKQRRYVIVNGVLLTKEVGIVILQDR
jgi:hypothetical protein